MGFWRTGEDGAETGRVCVSKLASSGPARAAERAYMLIKKIVFSVDWATAQYGLLDAPPVAVTTVE